MAQSAKQLATYIDVLNAPRHCIAELLNGVLHTHPRPTARHALASTKLGNQLGPAFDDGDSGPGGWIILDEPELHLGENVLVPDLAGWRRENMPEVPDVAFFELAPDWICEVLSPSTAAFDRVEKLPLYANADTSHLWLIDPKLQMLEVLQLDSGTNPSSWRIIQTFAGESVVRARPFEAIELRLGRLWGK